MNSNFFTCCCCYSLLSLQGINLDKIMHLIVCMHASVSSYSCMVLEYHQPNIFGHIHDFMLKDLSWLVNHNLKPPPSFIDCSVFFFYSRTLPTPHSSSLASCSGLPPDTTGRALHSMYSFGLKCKVKGCWGTTS